MKWWVIVLIVVAAMLLTCMVLAAYGATLDEGGTGGGGGGNNPTATTGNGGGGSGCSAAYSYDLEDNLRVEGPASVQAWGTTAWDYTQVVPDHEAIVFIPSGVSKVFKPGNRGAVWTWNSCTNLDVLKIELGQNKVLFVPSEWESPISDPDIRTLPSGIVD